MKKIHYTDRYLLNPYHPVTVFVIGAGGTGSQVATGLARMSVALQALGHPGLHVTVFDPDTVTEANIGRQLFNGSELGLNKAAALVTRINRFFGFSWEAKGQRYPLKASADREEPALANIIVTCTDNTRSRMNLWRFLKKHREHTSNNERSPIYWMDFGNARTTGQVLIGNIRGKILQPVLQRVPAHSPHECHYRRGTLLHHQGKGLGTELLAGGSLAEAGPFHQFHTGTNRLRHPVAYAQGRKDILPGSLSQSRYTTDKSHSGIDNDRQFPDYSRRAVQSFSRTALATPLSVMTSSYLSSLS